MEKAWGWGMALLLCSAPLGCVASRQSGEDPSERERAQAERESAQVDRVLELDGDLQALQCGCEATADDDCLDDATDRARDACTREVVVAHLAEFQPLLDCVEALLTAQRDCISSVACGDWEAMDRCQESRRDCDRESEVGERYAEEFEACYGASRGTSEAPPEAIPPDSVQMPVPMSLTCGNQMLDASEACDVIGGAPVFANGFDTCFLATAGQLPSGAVGCDLVTCTVDLSRCRAQ